MSESASTASGHGDYSREEMMSALFASMVMQQTEMAMLYLGQIPHPETGQPVLDLEAARMFIDQLEMLEAKTTGNLSKEEAALLKQSLSAARLAFVHAVKSEEKQAAVQPANTGGAFAAEEKNEPATAAATNRAATAEAEERKKYVKKY